MIIDINFRLNRIMAIETNMYNLDAMELVRPYPRNDLSERSASGQDRVEVMAAQTRAWKTGAHSFDLLGRYEARLSKQLLAYQKELGRLQAVRKAEETAAMDSNTQPARFYPSDAQLTRTASGREMASFGNDLPRAAAGFAARAESKETAPLNPTLASFGNSAQSPMQPRVFTSAQPRQPLPPPARLRVPAPSAPLPVPVAPLEVERPAA